MKNPPSIAFLPALPADAPGPAPAAAIPDVPLNSPGVPFGLAAAAPPRWSAAPRWRAALALGTLAAGLGAAALAGGAAPAGVDPELLRLLRGMALLKASVAVAVLGLVGWRLGRPVTRAAAAGYLAGVWALAGASVLIWFQRDLPAAAIAFHLGLLGLLLLGWREDGAALGLRFGDARNGRGGGYEG